MQLLGLCNSDEDIQRLFWRSTYRSDLSSLLSLALFPVIALAAFNWPGLNPLLKQIQNIHSFRAATQLRRAPNNLFEAPLSLLIASKSPSRLFGHGRREVVR
jgi:hypothetical protein